MRDCNLFPCKDNTATESDYQQPQVEPQHILEDCMRNCATPGPALETFEWEDQTSNINNN